MANVAVHMAIRLFGSPESRIAGVPRAALFELGNVAAQRGELKHAVELYEEATQTAEVARTHGRN